MALDALILLRESINRVPACPAGLKARRSALSGDWQHCVISIDKWRLVALSWPLVTNGYLYLVSVIIRSWEWCVAVNTELELPFSLW